MARPRTTIRRLTRVRDHGKRREITLFFTAESLGGKSGNSRFTFIRPEHVPDFDGEEAWFELERVSAKPWPYWRAIRQVPPRA